MSLSIQRLLVFFWLSVPLLLPAQEEVSYLGKVHTPAGRLHVLVIFVRYDNINLMKDVTWPDVSEEGQLPLMARGEINQWFYPEAEQIKGDSVIRNLSDYYYEMSGGKFLLTGEIFPVQVPVRYVSSIAGQTRMNRDAITWISENYPDFPWQKYDLRKNNPGYRTDNRDSGPDGVLDYVVFMHRRPGSGGIGSPGTFNIPGTAFRIAQGHTGFQSYSDAPHNWEYFKHEFAHNLYGCPHYLGANSADGNRFYTQKGWGLMSAWHAPFFAANAWECWWLGWLTPQEIAQNGTYVLQDFVTGRDALRIRLPGTQQYAWIENHQKLSHWDKKLFFSNPMRKEPLSARGIYAYVVAEPGSDRTQPHLNPFNKAHVNLIKVLNAEGNFDILATEDLLSNGFFETTVMEKVAPNPFSGQNDFQFIRQDFDKNGKIEVGMAHGNRDRGALEQKGVWSVKERNKNVLTLGNTGDGNDAFEPGERLGLSGIVPIAPFPTYDRTAQRLQPFLLNGLSVKIRNRNPQDGSFALEVRFDDWRVDTEVRWCGQLLLSATGDTLAADTLPLTVGRSGEVSLELGATPDRETLHPETGTFTNPTLLVAEKGRKILIEKKGNWIIGSFSELRLTDDCTLVVEQGAKLVIEDGGRLAAQDESRILLEKGAKLIIQSEGDLQLAGGEKHLVVKAGGRIMDKR